MTAKAEPVWGVDADGKATYHGQPQPDCFGVFWEAIPGPTGEDCRLCVFQAKCLDRFVEVTVPAALVDYPRGTDKVLGDAIGVSAVAIERARALHTGEVMRGEAAERNADERMRIAQQARDTNEVRRAAGHPTRARSSAGNAGGLAKSNGATASPVEESDEFAPWGEHTFQDRWERERDRSALVALVPVGSTLKAECRGAEHLVVVKPGYYLYKGARYPTLYKLAEEISGVSGRWSGARFFRLRRWLKTRKII